MPHSVGSPVMSAIPRPTERPTATNWPYLHRRRSSGHTLSAGVGVPHSTGQVLIGSHVSQDDPLAAAAAEGADVVQFFLGNPQSWKKPKPREDAAVLKAASMALYVHAPDLV